MAGSATAMAGDDAEGDDANLWLEEVQGERALAWVHARNAESRAQLQQHPRFDAMRSGLLTILDAPDKILQLSRRGDWLYNLWRDADHVRGLWRRCTLAGLCSGQPDWDPVLDIDALASAEAENWVWAGASSLGPAHRRCLVMLSRGGADACVVREFDLACKQFVADGFYLPEAKTDLGWETEHSLLVGTDVGPGSLTDSGYPRTLRRWQRGTPISAATLVFEGQAQDVAVSAWVDHRPGQARTVVERGTDFFNEELSVLHADGTLQRIHTPTDASLSFWRHHALLQLRSDWTVAGHTWPGGSLLVGAADALLAAASSADMPPLRALFTPTPSCALLGHATTASHVLLHLLDNVASRLQAWWLDGDGDGDGDGDNDWQHADIATPAHASLGLQTLHDDTLADDPLAEHWLLACSGFLTPDSLLLGHIDGRPLQTLQSRAGFFDASGLQVQQCWASSRDGTQVPYFLVAAQGLVRDGSHATLLNGYGGFQLSKLPQYSPGWGTAWLAHGGALAVANIRGGGEFGPAWHQAAMGANKQRSYDDFAAVAEHLVASGVTNPQRLAIQGGSNGGLLVGAVMLQRPELFGAVLCQVPLLDMRRYHRLLAGASWMAEYGNPDVAEQWAWISRYSPYQNLRPGMVLPKILLTTSTRDDRVHPGHARKMAARLAALGHKPLYFENTEGGHAGAADNRQKADMLALEFAFLWLALGG